MTPLELVVRLLGNGDSETVLDLADPRSLADRIMATDLAAAKRDAIVLAAGSRVHIDSGSLIQIR